MNSSSINELAEVFKNTGISAQKAAQSFEKMALNARKAITDEEMVAAIKLNPSMSWFQKRRLIRKIRRGQQVDDYALEIKWEEDDDD